jgi:hypothetical protein
VYIKIALSAAEGHESMEKEKKHLNLVQALESRQINY